MATDVNVNLSVQELLPATKLTDGALVQATADRGDGYKTPTTNVVGMASMPYDAEGSKFIVTNPIPGTALTYGSAGIETGWTDTKAFLVFQNNAAAGSGKLLYPHRLKILVSGSVPATATSTQFSVRKGLEPRIPSTNFVLLTTGGGVPVSPVGVFNANSKGSAAAGVNVWACNTGGAMAIPTSGASWQTMGRGSLRQSISVTLDEYELIFGGVDGPGSTAATVAGRYVGTCDSFALQPQEYCVVALWQPGGATNPLTYEFTLAGIIR